MKTTPYWVCGDDSPLPAIQGQAIADIVVIGGGLAGLTVAQLLSRHDYDIVVLEQETCGSGATLRSSGFVTPDTELEVGEITRRFGPSDAALIWHGAVTASEHVRATIEGEGIGCDFMPADCLYVATTERGRSLVRREHNERLRVGLSSSWYSRDALLTILGSDRFEGGLRYGGSFAVTPYRYVRGLRDRLRAKGVRIHERSAVVSVDNSAVSTSQARICCSAIVFCADRFLARIGNVKNAVHRTPTFVAATEVLSQKCLDDLFPDGALLVWDTDSPNHYFRRTADNRLLLGGNLPIKGRSAFSDPELVTEPFRTYVRDRLPLLGEVRFSHAWSGLIGTTKDFLPLAGRDRVRATHFYAGCGPGITWNVLAAQCVVETLIDGSSEFCRFLDPCRAFTDLDILQPVLQKPATFMLSHLYTKSLLRGSAEAVSKRRRWVVASLFTVLAAMMPAWGRAVGKLLFGRRGRAKRPRQG
jgi:gamma-glutamylputrescine oxidase